MAKARVTYGFGGAIVDANRNEAITDYITRGQCILTQSIRFLLSVGQRLKKL